MEPPLPCSQAISSLTSGGGMPRTEGRPSARRAPARPHKHRARREQEQHLHRTRASRNQTRTQALRTQDIFTRNDTRARTRVASPSASATRVLRHDVPRGPRLDVSRELQLAHTSTAATAVDKRVAAHQNTTKAAWLPTLLHSAPRRGGGGGRLYELAPPRGPHPPPTCATARRRRGPFAHDLEAGGRLADRGVRVPPGTTL